MLRTIGVVAAVLAALGVGACQEKPLTKEEFKGAIAYLRENPKEVEKLVQDCTQQTSEKQNVLQRKMMAISVGARPGASSKEVCTNAWKALLDGRVTYEEFYELLGSGS